MSVVVLPSLLHYNKVNNPRAQLCTTNPLDNKDSHGSSVSPVPGMVSMVEDSMSLEMRNFVFLLNRFSYFVAGLRQLRPPPSHIERRRTAAAVKSVLVSSLVL